VLPRANEAFEVLCKHLHAKDPRVCIAAATQILDRAYGRPPQTIDANINEDSSSVRFYAEVLRPAATTEEWLQSIRREDTRRALVRGVAVAGNDEQTHYADPISAMSRG
jgi:hypothetical protein